MPYREFCDLCPLSADERGPLLGKGPRQPSPCRGSESGLDIFGVLAPPEFEAPLRTRPRRDQVLLTLRVVLVWWTRYDRHSGELRNGLREHFKPLAAKLGTKVAIR